MSKVTKQTYVCFTYPGIIFGEREVKKVPNRDLKKLKIPVSAYKFFFFDIYSTKQNGMTLQSNQKNFSAEYYPDAEVLTFDQVKRIHPNERILIRNMEANKWNRMILCRTGNLEPYDPKNDVILPKKRSK